MAAPTITSLSTTIGPAHQWIYIFGTDFVEAQTQVYFNELSCDPVAVFNTTQIGFYLNSDCGKIEKQVEKTIQTGNFNSK